MGIEQADKSHKIRNKEGSYIEERTARRGHAHFDRIRTARFFEESEVDLETPVNEGKIIKLWQALIDWKR